MRKKGFEGWYFKHQTGSKMLAFIPGIAESGAFVQMISDKGSKHFSVSSLSVGNGVIEADKCRFSRRGCVIDLPGVDGSIDYGKLTPLQSDIMGLFRYFPMECRHGVISMSHTLSGCITVDGDIYDFGGGKGYIEKDSGTSFPRSYQWLQCNDFDADCSVMLSIAEIPFCGLSFTGCICAIVYEGREYRLATYKGVRINAASAEHISLSQGRLLLDLDIRPHNAGHILHSPVNGIMSGRIRECSSADMRIRLWEAGKSIFDLESSGAAYEYAPNAR